MQRALLWTQVPPPLYHLLPTCSTWVFEYSADQTRGLLGRPAARQTRFCRCHTDVMEFYLGAVSPSLVVCDFSMFSSTHVASCLSRTDINRDFQKKYIYISQVKNAPGGHCGQQSCPANISPLHKQHYYIAWLSASPLGVNLPPPQMCRVGLKHAAVEVPYLLHAASRETKRIFAPSSSGKETAAPS